MWLWFMEYAWLFQPRFGSNMDKPKCWLKNVIKKIQLKVEVELKFKMTFLTQHLGLPIFDPTLG